MSISITNLGRHRDTETGHDVRAFDMVESNSYSPTKTREIVTISEKLEGGAQMSGEAGVWPVLGFKRRFERYLQ